MADAPAPSVVPAPTNPAEAAKKKAGYHYWHSHGKERALVGDVAPMPKPQQVLDAVPEFDAVASLKKVTMTAYSWCDNTKTVSVYVDFKGVGAIDSPNIVTRYTERSMRLAIEHEGKEHVLVIHLARAINPETSSHKVKPDQLVFRLVKAEEVAWFDLTGAAVAGEEDE